MLTRRTIFCAAVIIAALSFNCDKDDSTSPESENNLTGFTGEYLGLQPPGTQPFRFAESLLMANSSWWWHGPPVFSPDGTELFFSKYINTETGSIIMQYMKIENGRWTIPESPPFADEDGCNNPVFAENGNRLYFISQSRGGLVYVNRTENGWSQPVSVNLPVPSSHSLGWQFSIIGDKTIYAELWSDNGPDLYKFSYVDNSYSEPENLGDVINTEHSEFAPFVASDESYLIFTSNRPGGYGRHDLYISFRNNDGSWTEPKNMGSEINAASEDAGPMISNDGRYFFFTSQKGGDLGYNPYWISSQIIEDLK